MRNFSRTLGLPHLINHQQCFEDTTQSMSIPLLHRATSPPDIGSSFTRSSAKYLREDVKKQAPKQLPASMLHPKSLAAFTPGIYMMLLPHPKLAPFPWPHFLCFVLITQCSCSSALWGGSPTLPLLSKDGSCLSFA